MRERKIIKDESSLESLRNEFELERFFLRKMREMEGYLCVNIYIYITNSCNFFFEKKKL